MVLSTCRSTPNISVLSYRLEDLVITQTLSREPEKYSVLSTSAVIAKQLQRYGKKVQRGQHIRFIYIAPAPGVWAWDLPTLHNPKDVDRIKYRELLIRATLEILQPLGVTEAILKNWLFSDAGYLALPGFLPAVDQTRWTVPLFQNAERFRLGS